MMTTSSSDHTASTFASESLARPSVVTGDQTRAVFGQVMGLVAATAGFLALGAYLGRDLSGGLGIAFFLAAFASLIGLNIASGRSRQQLSITLLFGFGLLLGLALGPVTNAYAKTDPSAPNPAAIGTVRGLRTAALPESRRPDLSNPQRLLDCAFARSRLQEPRIGTGVAPASRHGARIDGVHQSTSVVGPGCAPRAPPGPRCGLGSAWKDVSDGQLHKAK